MARRKTTKAKWYQGRKAWMIAAALLAAAIVGAVLV